MVARVAQVAMPNEQIQRPTRPPRPSLHSSGGNTGLGTPPE